MGRPKKDTTKTTDIAKTEAETSPIQEQPITTFEDFALNFARALNSTSNNPVFYNPIWQNSILKDINMSPASFDRDTIEKLVSNPKNNEDALKDLSQYLMNVIMQFNRLVRYYSTILTFDYLHIPTNADEDDMKTPAFKKSRKKATEWVERLNPKTEFPKILEGVILEDAKFYYVRESDDSVVLQEMPSKYCKIVGKTEYGYQYAFNMYYFLRAGININDYDNDFIEYFSDFLENKNNKDQYFYWQKLDPLKAPCFKFDENRAGLTPPLMGLFLDSAEIANYKKLLKTKTTLEIVKILVNKIPMHNDSKGAQTKNNFAIDPDTAAKFTTMIQNVLPEGYKALTSPLEVQPIDFSQSQNRDNIVGYGQDNFYNSAGTSPIMFGEKNLNGSGLEASQRVDEAYVMHMYRQFERFINAWLKTKTGKFRFKVMFPDITIFNWEKKADQYLKGAQSGFSKSLYSVAIGVNPDDMLSLLMYENSLDIISKYLIPLQSSHVQSGEGGRPAESTGNLGDAGIKTRDANSNANR